MGKILKKTIVVAMCLALGLSQSQPVQAAAPRFTISHPEFIPVSLQKSWTISFRITPKSKAKGQMCSLWASYSRTLSGQGIGPDYIKFNSAGVASFTMTTKEIQRFSSRGPDSKQPAGMWFAGSCAGFKFRDRVIYLSD